MEHQPQGPPQRHLREPVAVAAGPDETGGNAVEEKPAAAFGRPKASAIRRWLSLGITGALTVLTVVVLGLAAVTAVGFLGYRTVTVQTTALQPEVSRWTLLVEKTVAPADLHAGDIITFTSDTTPGAVFTHHVIAVEPQAQQVSLLTKPVGQEAEERQWQVSAQQMVGKVVARVPLVGYPLQIGDQPMTLGLLIVAGLALLGLRSRFGDSKTP